jgi:8-oxo-dGTP pyrophosphatase MutT (NUDIX family)
MTNTESLPDREAAKIILYADSELSLAEPKFICVYGASKNPRLNLPGGAIDEFETPEVAAERELFEELNLTMHDVSRLEPVGQTTGVTTPGGVPMRTLWHLYKSRLLIPSSELAISNEISRVDVLTEKTILEHGNASKLAQQAIVHVARMERQARSANLFQN